MVSCASLTLSDEDFLTAFERAALAPDAFPHQAHLRLAWLYVRRLGLSRALDKTTAGLRALATRHGHAGRYHDTLTRAWVYLVAAASADDPAATDFDAFLRRHPELLDKDYVLRYYSPERLSRPQARAGWLSPDRRAIPGAPDTGVGETGAHLPHAAPVPAEAFRQALAQIPCPVAVLTAGDATRLHGTTVSALTSVSLDPPLLLICVHHDSRVLPIVRAAGGFAVSYLARGQRSLATHFADPARREGVEQFQGVPHVMSPLGAPIITGGPAWFACVLDAEFAVADHQIVCGMVMAHGVTDTRALQRRRGTWV